ncbi:MAG TPA: hypothetical protein VLT33_14560, partial [Labilithrix sp.]|nr:hypothetical protein [Labilithrix sp.]
MTRRVLLPFVVAMALPLRAAASDGAVQITLDAPEPCPTRDVLLASAQRRAPALRVSAGDEALRVHVRIVRLAGGYAAKVTLESERASEERTLQATTCGELVDASGLLIALFVR